MIVRSTQYFLFRLPGIVMLIVGLLSENDCLYWAGVASWATVMLCDYTDRRR